MWTGPACSPARSASINLPKPAPPTPAKADRAFYFWQYPNFMLNWYEGYLDTNLVLPLGAGKCEVIFDFYFGNVTEDNMPYIRESMGVSELVQQEDIVICDGVPARPQLPRLQGRPPLRPPRNRRTSLPSPARRRPKTLHRRQRHRLIRRKRALDFASVFASPWPSSLPLNLPSAWPP